MTQSNPCDTLFPDGPLNRLIAGNPPDCQTAGPPDRLVSGTRSPHSGSPGHHFELIMQADGNLVLYRHDGGTNTDQVKWATHTVDKGATECIMQPDGNLVLYSFPSGQRTAVWASGTAGHPGATATMQDDGNFVIYDGKIAIWATGTVSD